MQRRKFLGTVGLGLGATALPVWLSRSFGLDRGACPEDLPSAPPSEPPLQMECEPVAGVEPTVPRKRCDPAPGAGVVRPQLVLVIPEDVDSQVERGHAFGELINHGSDAQLANLAPFDVVCRKLSELPPELAKFTRAPLMVILEAGVATVLDAELPPTIYQPPTWEPDPDIAEGTYEQRTERRIQVRIDLLGKLIADQLTRDRLGAQAVRELAALPCEAREQIFHEPRSLEQMTPAQIDRVAASALLAALDRSPAERPRLLAPLAEAARARLAARPLLGAKWANAHGCGIEVEGEEPMAIGCGMGHVPRRSTRFLMFFANPYR